MNNNDHKFNNFLNTAGHISSLLTIIGAAIGAVWFFVGLDKRISSLESQVQFLVTQPHRQISEMPPQYNDNTSPVEQACADLIRKATEANATNQFTAASSLESLISKLKCSSFVKDK